MNTQKKLEKVREVLQTMNTCGNKNCAVCEPKVNAAFDKLHGILFQSPSNDNTGLDTPDGTLRWECVEKADLLIPPKGEEGRRGIEVLMLANRLYAFRTGEEFEPSTDADLREEFTAMILEATPIISSENLIEKVDDLVSYIRLGRRQPLRNAFETSADQKEGTDETEFGWFDSMDTFSRTYDLLQLEFSNQETSKIVGILGNAGIRFTSTSRWPD